MNRFAQKLLTQWRRLELPVANQTIVVAVSGGADSVSLLGVLHELTILKKLKLQLVAAHFNHNLRGAESERDAQFVQELAAQFNFEFVLGNETPNSKFQIPKGNLEQAARRARYDFLGKTAKNFEAPVVLTAHTLDDQAETFLLRLVRGSGADGLAAMQTIRLLENKSQTPNPKPAILLVRPLLNWARREMTEKYCRDLKIEWRRDAMNEDLHFSRVRMRRELLPLLKTFNPRIVEILGNTTGLLREDVCELDRQAAEIFAAAIVEENNLATPENFIEAAPVLLATRCAELSPALRRRVVRLWLVAHRGDLRRISFKHLRAIDNLVLSKRGGKIVELPGGSAITRKQNHLFFVKS